VPVRLGSRRELNPDKTRGQIRLQRLAYRFASKVVANSSAAQAMLRSEGLAPTSIAVIPNGVHVDSFPPRRAERPRGGPPTVITVANLRPEKNHETLIAAAAVLAPRFPGLRLRIVGTGPRREALQALVASRGLHHHVEFLGHREDVPALLADADVFVLPSRSEAFPNSAIEAMAAGLPVVATAVGGLRELIDDGRTGLLVPRPDDAGALAGAVERVLADDALAARLGAAARAEARERYSFDRMVGAFEDLYVTALPARALAGVPRAQAAGF
jgi:glycosyltransferase involved in cell wall biosynthesis